MKPDPNSPSFYLYDENNVEADADNGNADVDSNSPSSFSTPPRMVSPEEDGMEVGGGSDEERGTSRHGSKRTRQEREESEEQQDLLSSTEPVTKKRRTQEPAAQANNTKASNTTGIHPSVVREYQNLQQLVNWTCEHLLETNQGRAFRIGDLFTYNTFAHFRNALEKATQSNAPELIKKLFETGIQNCVPEVIENALAIANSMGAHDVIALLNQYRNVSSSSSMSSNSSSTSSTTDSTSANSLSASLVPLSGLEAGWQKKVRLDLNDEEIDELLKNLTNPEHGARQHILLFGENHLNGKYEVREIAKTTENMMQLLIACGAVCLHKDKKVVMLSSDFDRDKFLAGLLTIQEEERVAAENLAEGIPNRLFSALMLATLWGDLEMVRTLLDNGALPLAVTLHGENALMFAAKSGRLEIVRLLLNYNINVNAVNEYDTTALIFATNEGHYAVCQLLLQSGARLDIISNSMPLHTAARYGNAALCRLFIRHGADINQIDSNNETPLFCAAYYQDLSICKLLLELGANINFRNSESTILREAINSRNVEVVEYLLSQGAEIDGTPPSGNGLTPLTYAAINDQSEIVELLLDRGAQIDRTDQQNCTALWNACTSRGWDAAKLLLQRGANPNMADVHGVSIIEVATGWGNVEIVKLLMQHGVALFSQRNDGYRALKLAVKYGNCPIASLLLNANVPTEMIVDKQPPSLLILAIQSLSGDNLLAMLTLLLQHNASLRKTDDKGNDALMLAVKLPQFEAFIMFISQGLEVGQINTDGQNALAIAIDALDLNLQAPEQQISHFVYKLVGLLNQAQLQPNWLALRKDALNRAQYPITREIILVSWAWPLNTHNLPIIDLAKKNILVGVLHDFIQFVINSPNAVDSETIDYMLGMAGLCPPLINLIRPYIAALSQIKSLLFGNSAIVHDNIISAFIAGLAVVLEKIHLQPGEHWKPYVDDFSNSHIDMALNQIANAELDSLMATSAAIESDKLSPVFKTLFETCFNLSFTEAFLPATFPAYAAAPGALADALMAKGVYSTLATKIEATWKKTWAMFEGKEMSSASGTTSRSASGAWSTSSASSHKNTSSNLHRSPPRMRSPEVDGMDVDGMEVDGASNEKVSADFLRQGIKRSRQENEGVDDQEARLSSSEPVNKKRRIQESDAQKNSSSSSATSHLHAVNSPESSTATLAASAASIAPETDWQKKVLPSLDGCKLDGIYRDLTAEGGTTRLLTFLFGEEIAHWPKGEFRLIKISVIPEQMKKLLVASGAVYLCSIYEENHNFLFSSDFDLDRFRAGLLDIQNKEKNQAAEDDDDDERDQKIFTALMLAAEWGDLASVQLLLENGAIPAALNVDNGNALMLAAAAGHVEILRLLLSYDVDVDALNSLRWSAFSKAAAAGQDTVCELLLEHGASLDIYTEDTHIPLHVAAKGGYTDLCERLIQLGCDVNQLDDHEVTPLIRAAQAGHLDTCKLLLSSGANIHQDNSTGQMVLISAISSGNLELVEYLLVQGAPIEGVPNKFTPLIDATKRNYLAIIKTLLKMGAGVNRTGIHGSTALYFACQLGSLEATKLLLQAGADPNLATSDTQASPLLAAACAGSVPIFKLLLQNGASFFSESTYCSSCFSRSSSWWPS
jgi:ankyrin repeat protein